MLLTVCLACSGKGKLLRRYVNADLREKCHVYTCSRCGGIGRILLPLSYKDRAAGENEDEG